MIIGQQALQLDKKKAEKYTLQIINEKSRYNMEKKQIFYTPFSPDKSIHKCSAEILYRQQQIFS